MNTIRYGNTAGKLVYCLTLPHSPLRAAAVLRSGLLTDCRRNPGSSALPACSLARALMALVPPLALRSLHPPLPVAAYGGRHASPTLRTGSGGRPWGVAAYGDPGVYRPGVPPLASSSSPSPPRLVWQCPSVLVAYGTEIPNHPLL
jgi:hypothetical protein